MTTGARRLLGVVAFTALAIGLAMSGSRTAKADIIKVTGQGNKIATSAGGYTANFFNDPTGKKSPPPLVHGWNEKQFVTLSKDVYIDISVSGTYNQNSDLLGFRAGKVKAGTYVNSHYLYFDPKGSKTANNVTFEFDGTILGVIVESDRFYKASTKTVNYNFTDYFLESDFLASASSAATPGTHFNNRGLELGNPDSVVVNVGARTITVNLGASNPGDQVRILTAVPEPATMAVAGIGVVCVGGVLRRFRKKPDHPTAA